MTVMALQIKQVSNPLTLIAIFASLAEIAATSVLPIVKGEVQGVFVWYVMLFLGVGGSVLYMKTIISNT